MIKQITFLLIGASTAAGYCTWKSTCDGESQGGSWCNQNESQCIACGNGSQWCSESGPSPTPSPTPNGYCNWDNCNGEAQGGTWCNSSKERCENCGSTDPSYQPQWCTTGNGPTPAPITPAPVPQTPITPAPVTPAPVPIGGDVGWLTWWTDSFGAVQGGSCEYAQTVSTAEGSSWLAPYIIPGMHCAVSDDLYDSGAGCGKCYSVAWDGTEGTDPGTPGSAIVQITNSGAGGDKHFDCFDDAFQAIVGTNTGIFPGLTYVEVDCTDTPPTVVILDGNNAWYTKVLIAGGKTSVSAVTMTVGITSFAMNRNSGATWYANLDGQSGVSTKFDIIFSNGAAETVDGCFGDVWPVPTSSQCS